MGQDWCTVYSQCCGGEHSKRLQNELNMEEKRNVSKNVIHLPKDRRRIKSLPKDKNENIVLTMNQHTTLNEYYLYITDLNSTLNWKCKLYDINNTQKQIQVIPDGFPIMMAGMCYQHNVQLSNNIHQLLNSINNDWYNSTYNVIFRTGGVNTAQDLAYQHCDAIIMNQNEMKNAFNINDDKFHEIKGVVCKLPNLPYTLFEHDLVYSDKYGLITISGQSSSKTLYAGKSRECLMNLEINNDDAKWEKLVEMNNGRCGSVGVILKDDGYSKQEKGLMVISGAGPKSNTFTKDVDFYDFETNEWSKLASLHRNSSGRCYLGKYYDGNNDLVYIGGGSTEKGSSKLCEYYDMNKDKWYRLPNTNGGHGYYPRIWKQEKNVNILCIAAGESGIEWMDLRTKKWNFDPKTGLLDLFDLNPGIRTSVGKAAWYRFMK